MKSFRGTFISAGFAAALGLGWFLNQPKVEPIEPKAQLFQFEKHELIKVEIQKPNAAPLVLEEIDGEWIIAGTAYTVSKSMVNRIKHQLHDLTARTLVDSDPSNLTRYGLGDKGIQVRLYLRSGEKIAFSAGDPNPTGVSYYIQPESGEAVYTVKKSALDYYGLELSAFRESRFAYFASKEVTRVVVNAQESDDFTLQIGSDQRWTLIEPYEMPADSDAVRRLLGRIAALKARRFSEAEDAGYPSALFNEIPRLKTQLTLQSGTEITVQFFGRIEEDGEWMTWVKLNDESSAYLVPERTVEAFAIDLQSLKDRSVFPLATEDILKLSVSAAPLDKNDPEGDYSAQLLSGEWTWQDGVPVPGSTPNRLAMALSGIRVIEFLDGQRSDFKLEAADAPLHIQADSEHESVNVYVGIEGEALVDEEGNEFKRVTMAIDEAPQVYLIDVHLRSVGHDFIREGGRRNEQAEAQADRREELGIEEERE